MKLLIASDLHGSIDSGKILKEIFEKGSFDKLIILGDFLYHGPRNPIPENYNPALLAELLNTLSDKIIAVRGNCDAEVDQMVLNFPIMDSEKIIQADDKTFYLAHGHLINPDDDKRVTTDVVLTGHTHIPVLASVKGIIVGNPGSTTLPKDGSERSYMTYDNGVLSLISLISGKVLRQLVLETSC